MAAGFDNGKFQVFFQGPSDCGVLTLSPLILHHTFLQMLYQTGLP